jgi:hypothetical protein
VKDPDGGAVAQPFEMRIELGKVREFARATGSRHPQHTEGETPVSPVTFLQSSAFWQTRENSPLPAGRDLRRILHAEQEFTFPKGPPRAGVTLTGQSRIEKEWTKEGRRGGQLRFVTVVTDYSDSDGEVVAQVRATTVTTSKAAGAS